MRRFLGIGEDKLNKFILDIYLILIKCIIKFIIISALPVSFYKLFEENHKQYHMNTELCFEIFYSKLREFKSLVNETKYPIIRNTIVYINDKEQKGIREEKKFDYMTMNRFYIKSYVYINDLITDYKSNVKTHEILANFYDHFSFSNKEFQITNEEFLSIFNRIFKINNGLLELEKFFNFFEGKKFSFKIKNDDFIESSLSCVIGEHAYLNNKLNVFFELVDAKKKSIIFFKEFEELMVKIFVNTDTRWKNNDYFL